MTNLKFTYFSIGFDKYRYSLSTGIKPNLF